MPKKEREKKKLSKRIVVYCEGGTEENYSNGLKKRIKEVDPSTKVAIKPEDIGGGGYKSFYDELIKEPDSNCIARVVLLDLDRYTTHPEERPEFMKLVELSRGSMSKHVPCILIGSYEDFEYCLCCHDAQYKDGDTTAFLTKKWGYSSLDECKADENVWKKAHTGKRSCKQAVDHLAGRPKAIKNAISAVKGTHSVKLADVTFDDEKISGRGSNFEDLFKTIGVDPGVL